jgi:hypothetical protein
MRTSGALYLAMAGLTLMPSSASDRIPSNDADTACAAVYTLLAEQARSSGSSSDRYETLAFTAQQAHLQAYPLDDARRYTLHVVDSADAMRQAAANGSLTEDMIQSAEDGCNARYDADGSDGS